MHVFTVKGTEHISPDTLLLTLQPKRNKDQLQFYPGQYMTIGYTRGGRPSPMRCFSVISSPNKLDTVQFAMRVYGDFTHTVANLALGDTVFVRGPFGDFVIDEQRDHSVVLLAGGIGVTPFISMIRYATETTSPIPITLLYSCRSQDNVPFYKELLELERQNPHFKVTFFITQGATNNLKNGQVYSGRLEETRLTQLLSKQDDQATYLLCGPKDFTKSMRTILTNLDADPTRIITEDFTPTSQTNALLASPKHSITQWTYGLTTASLALGIILVMAMDLTYSIPKLSAQAAPTTPVGPKALPTTTVSPLVPSSTSTTASPPTSPAPTSTQSSAPAPTVISSSDTTNQVASPTLTPSATTSQTAPPQTSTQPSQSSYQAPVTSVS